MADGPVIQRSSERALKKGVNLQKCLNWVKEFRLQNKFTPIVLMGYANPIERFGIEDFAKEASNADVDGVLIVDYPPEEALNFCRLMKTHHIDVIFLLAPTTSIERLKHIARLGSGYLYYVSLRGVTGAKNIDISDVSNRLKIIREISPLPTVVGFGISTPKSAAEVATTPADGVVIGSAIIDKLDNANKLGIDPLIEISGFIKNIKKEINISTRALL